MYMGSETEFGIAGGGSYAKAEAIHSHLVYTRSWLPSVKSGIYLENGARVYIDLGEYNEYATPEVETPSSLVVAELVGRRLMQESATHCGEVLLCSNVDPFKGSSRGTHENYGLNRRLSFAGWRALYTHLATRIIYSGTGGIRHDFQGIQPVLSPRALRIVASFTVQGVCRKSLVFQKGDHYGMAYRLHVGCGESQLSHLASYLKYASTALVAAALDARLPVNWPCVSGSPVRALYAINRDLALSRRLRLEDGRLLTALEIQQTIVDGLERHLGQLPPWAPEALQQWRGTLDGLASGAVEGIDWKLTLGLLNELAESYGITAQEISLYNAECLHRQSGARARVPLDPEFTRLRDACHEVYIRLHMLGSHSLFDQLATERGWRHAAPGVTEDRIREAMRTPPPGRASMRASLIRRRQVLPGVSLMWDLAVDPLNQRRLEIPVQETPGWDFNWIPFGHKDGGTEFSNEVRMELLFRKGDFIEVALAMPYRQGDRFSRLPMRCMETICLAHARCGLLFDLPRALEHYERAGASPLARIALELFCRVHEGLMPPVQALLPLVARGDELLADGPVASYDRFVFLQNKGWIMAAAGEHQLALDILLPLILDESHSHRVRMLSRTRCYAAEVLRRMGRIEDARSCIAEAERLHRFGGMLGDLALHSLPVLALLAESEEAAERVFDEAEAVANQTMNPLAMARIFCLRARRLPGSRLDMKYRNLLKVIRPLRGCALTARILSEWEVWSAGPDPAQPHDYWSLG